jgi:opacity protein-like surface antigen
MIRKFTVIPGFWVVQAVICFLMTLGGSAVFAQLASAQGTSDQTSAQQPAAQQPAAQQPADQQSQSQSSSQEASPEEVPVHRRVKPKEYKNWNFNVGGGANLTGGTTERFVIGGGGAAAGGVARNYSKYLGLRLDFQFDNLPLRNSALLLAQAPGANSHVYMLMLDPIINIPVNRLWSAYIVFGPAFDHRTGKLNSSTATPGEACNPFFAWWGRCYANSLPLNVNFLRASQNEFGYNVGGGVARKVHGNIEIYAEVRITHGTHNGVTTDVRPVTMGVRW